MGEQVDLEEELINKAQPAPVKTGATHLERIHTEVARIEQATRALQYTLGKRDVVTLMADPVHFVDIMGFVHRLDPRGLRLWVNKTMYGVEDFTIAGLRRMASKLGIQKYGSKTKEEILEEIAKIRNDSSHLTKEELADEFIPGESGDDDYLHPKSAHRSH